MRSLHRLGACLFLAAVALGKPAQGIELIPQTGHADNVAEVSFSPDGRLLASSGNDRQLRLWDLKTMKEVFAISGGASGGVFSRDGERLVIKNVADPFVLQVWSLPLKKMLSTIPLEFRPGELQATPDGSRVLLVDRQQAVLLDLDQQKRLASLKPFQPDDWFIGKHAISQDGRLGAFSASPNYMNKVRVEHWEIRVIELASGRLVATLPNTSQVKDMAFDAAGGSLRVATFNRGQEVTRWSLASGKLMQREMVDRNACVNFDARGEGMILVGGGRYVQRPIGPGRAQADFAVGPRDCWVQASPDGSKLALPAQRQIGLRDAATGQLEAVLGGGASRTILVADVSPNGKLLAGSATTIQEVATTQIFDLESLKGVRAFEGQLIGFLDDHRVLVRHREAPETLSVVDVRTGERSAGIPGRVAAFHRESRRLLVHRKAVDVQAIDMTAGGASRSLAFKFGFGNLGISPDGKYFGAYDGERMMVWAADSGQVLIDEAIKGYYPSPVFSPDSRRVALPVRTGAKLWSLPDGKALLEIGGGERSKARFSPDGQVLALSCSHGACKDSSVDVFRVADGRREKRLAVGGEWVTDFEFSPDGQRIAAVSSAIDAPVIKVFRLTDGQTEHEFAGHRYWVSRVFFSRDGQRVISASRDGTVRLWNLKNRESVAIAASDQEWVAYTPDGYFDASRDGGRLVAIVERGAAYEIDQFALRGNRPDLLFSRLGNEDPGLQAHFRGEYQKRLRRAGYAEQQLSPDIHVPLASITDTRISDRTATLALRCEDRKADLSRYNLFVNDVPLFGGGGKAIQGRQMSAVEEVVLNPGRNKIEFGCINAAGAESFRSVTYAEYGKPVRGDLYFLGFGVSRYKDSSLDLAFAHKDAIDLADVFSRIGKVSKGPFGRTHTRTLIDQEVTARSIREAKDFLARTRPEDTVVLFIAGHGMHARDKGQGYFYLTHDADPDRLPDTAASFDLVEDLLQGIGARRKLFLMDTCESGEADEALAVGGPTASAGLNGRGLARKESATEVPKRIYLRDRDRYIYNDLTRRTGAIVFSSSRGGELSYESAAIQNGLFTREIINALTGRGADSDRNGLVSTDELRSFVSASVARASNQLQNPTVDRDNLFTKFAFPVLAK